MQEVDKDTKEMTDTFKTCIQTKSDAEMIDTCLCHGMGASAQLKKKKLN